MHTAMKITEHKVLHKYFLVTKSGGQIFLGNINEGPFFYDIWYFEEFQIITVISDVSRAEYALSKIYKWSKLHSKIHWTSQIVRLHQASDPSVSPNAKIDSYAQ